MTTKTQYTITIEDYSREPTMTLEDLAINLSIREGITNVELDVKNPGKYPDVKPRAVLTVTTNRFYHLYDKLAQAGYYIKKFESIKV